MRYYGVDLREVILGGTEDRAGLSPFFVYHLATGLPDTSLTAAAAAGGREHYGWGRDRYMLADIFDALVTNTRATGNWGKKGPPKFPSYPRPGVKEKKKDKEPVTVKSLYQRFARR